jgi:hypothetical protein
LASLVETQPPSGALVPQAHRLWLDARRTQRLMEQNPERYEAHRAVQNRRVAGARVCETPEQREARLAAGRLREAAARANETPEESLARHAANALSTAVSRADETADQLAARHAADALCKAAARANDTPEQSLARHAANAFCTAATRANETPERASARRAADAGGHANRTASLEENSVLDTPLEEEEPSDSEQPTVTGEIDDGLTATLEDLVQAANMTLPTGPVTEETYQKCIEALRNSQSDLYNNVKFCTVCDLFKKKNRFKPPFNANAVNIGDEKLLKGMKERLQHASLTPPLPSSRELGDFNPEHDGCREQALKVGETRANGVLRGLVLGIAGFEKKTPPGANMPDYFNVCFTCYNSLTANSKKNLPPAESLANGTFIGTCWLDALPDHVQYKMLSLIYTKTEVVIYKMYKGAHRYLTAHVLSYANKTPVDPEMFPILTQLPHRLTKKNFTAVFAGTFEAWAKIAAR